VKKEEKKEEICLQTNIKAEKIKVEERILCRVSSNNQTQNSKKAFRRKRRKIKQSFLIKSR
jgi:hypothetical protein